MRCPHCGEGLEQARWFRRTKRSDLDVYRCRVCLTVCHSQSEWARDDDGDGVREVHINSNEGGWTGLRNFLRPFRGVHKQYLSGDVAIHEFSVNHKAISPDFVSALVRSHLF